MGALPAARAGGGPDRRGSGCTAAADIPPRDRARSESTKSTQHPFHQNHVRSVGAAAFLAFDIIPVGKPVTCQGYRIRAIPVRHPVHSVGYIIESNGSAIAFSGLVTTGSGSISI